MESPTKALQAWHYIDSHLLQCLTHLSTDSLIHLQFVILAHSLHLSNILKDICDFDVRFISFEKVPQKFCTTHSIVISSLPLYFFSTICSFSNCAFPSFFLFRLQKKRIGFSPSKFAFAEYLLAAAKSLLPQIFWTYSFRMFTIFRFVCNYHTLYHIVKFFFLGVKAPLL